MTDRIKHAALAAFTALICIGFAGCSAAPSDIPGRTFVYEKDGFGSDFTIKLNGDGTFTYYEGAFSSYVGSGEWSSENGVLTLSENRQDRLCEMRFAEGGGSLLFCADGSDNFMYVKAEDGDRFLAIKD